MLGEREAWHTVGSRRGASQRSSLDFHEPELLVFSTFCGRAAVTQ